MQGHKEFPVTAISLKYYDLAEADKIIVLFTRERGIVRAVAKGLKKAKSKFAGRLDLLNVNELIIREGKNMGTITQCETVQVFPKLRLDYDRLIYSLFMGELITLFISEGEISEDIFELLIDTLQNIQNADNPLLYSIWFEIQFLTLLGYQSNLTECDICGITIPEKNYKLGFSLNTGSVICDMCMKIANNYKIINDDIRNILKNLKLIDVSNLEEVTADKFLLEKIQLILKEYFSMLSERKIKTLSII